MPYSQKLQICLIMLFTLGGPLSQAHAQENKPLLERSQFSIGLGISDNERSNPDEDDTGFQFFATYDLKQVNLMDGVNSSFGFGFMDFGFDKDDTGIWGAYIIDGSITGRLGWLAQAGLDIGDDSGLLLGAGLQIMLDDEADLRFEYVVRDDVDSLQFNFLYHL